MYQPPPIASDAAQPAPPPASPARSPDPGSPKAARVAWLVLLVVLPIVIAFQQLQAHAEPEIDPSQIAPPRGDQVEVGARLGTRATYALGQGGGSFQQQVDTPAEGSPLHEFRAAITAGELIGPREAADRLDDIAAELQSGASDAYPPDDPNAQARKAQLLIDARLLAAYYAELAEDESTVPLDEDTIAGLIERHGFFGELVRVASLPSDHQAREQLLDGALFPLLVMMVLMGLVVLAIVAGLALGITAIVMAALGSIRFAMPRPGPGGSVYLESAVLFVACFALLQILQGIAALIGEPALTIAGVAAMPAQWLLLLVPLWPLVRGVTWSQLRTDLGLRAHKGVFFEILAGTAGYLALLPLVLAGVAVMLVLLSIQQALFPGDPDATGPTNPILELVKTLDPILLLLLFTLATIWAPLCEELVFRGALFRHMRARLAVPIAALLSAMVFGLMHGYAALQLIPVTILGFNFALLRAWRGSLIGPIFAHALNNAVVLGLLYALAFTLYG